MLLHGGGEVYQMRKPRLLEVEWIDSSTAGRAWYNKEDLEAWLNDQETLFTVGYFVGEDKKFLTLCSSLGGWDQKGGIWSIPKAAIVRRRRLK